MASEKTIKFLQRSFGLSLRNPTINSLEHVFRWTSSLSPTYTE